jgi:hypothetical protein
VTEQSAGQARLDLDRVADGLAGLRPVWTALGVRVGQLTWRDAPVSWPQPIVTDRSQVAEPESVGISLTTYSGNEALVVTRRG